LTNRPTANLFVMDQEADGTASGEVEGLAWYSRGDEGLARRLKALACTAPFMI
jgi:hypothetical protein